jgi:ClpP class serine protease
MNVSKKIENLTHFEQVGIILALLFGTFGAGYTASEVSQPQAVDELNNFDVFAYKAQEEVKPVMDNVLAYPTDNNLREANNYLKISVKNWESRETGENKELFKEYRIACQEVIDSIQAEESNSITEVKIKEMNEAYLKLNPN